MQLLPQHVPGLPERFDATKLLLSALNKFVFVRVCALLYTVTVAASQLCTLHHVVLSGSHAPMAVIVTLKSPAWNILILSRTAAERLRC